MNQRLKQEILDATRKAGCDWDGDTIIYNGKKYYIDITRGGVTEIGISGFDKSNGPDFCRREVLGTS